MHRALLAIASMALLGLPLGASLLTPAGEAEITFYQDVAWSPDGRNLATSAMRIPRALWEKEQFGALQRSQFDLYVVSVDGSRTIRITNQPDNELWATWWPGGRCLLFTAERKGFSGLHFVRADGSDRQTPKGLPPHASQPSVSPDGKTIAFMSREGPESHVYAMAGGAPRKLTSAGPNNWNPVFSPDGTRILFFSDRQGKGRDQIFVVNADGSAETQLTKDESNNIFPSWSPDGRRIIFSSNREGKGKEGIFAMNADGSDLRRLIPGMPAAFARWSPDGTKLAFISGKFPDTQINVADADGANPIQLTR